ncbi:hypothetical protein [Streptomyces graminilatus]|nr:hypothetical protein [Streptomyces graminilatus]
MAMVMVMLVITGTNVGELAFVATELRGSTLAHRRVPATRT